MVEKPARLEDYAASPEKIGQSKQHY